MVNAHPYTCNVVCLCYVSDRLLLLFNSGFQLDGKRNTQFI